MLFLPIKCGSAWFGSSGLSLSPLSFDRALGKLFVLAFSVILFFCVILVFHFHLPLLNIHTSFEFLPFCHIQGQSFDLSIVQKKKKTDKRGALPVDAHRAMKKVFEGHQLLSLFHSFLKGAIPSLALGCSLSITRK